MSALKDVPVRRALHPRPPGEPRIGLALGSGVARGWAHIGALRALDKAGVHADVIAGTSIGALVGGFYLAGQLDELENWARGLTRMRIFRLLDMLPAGGGVLTGEKLEREMDEHLLDLQVRELNRPFVPVATDLRTGHEVWVRDARLADAIRASFSIPGVFRPVSVDGRWLVDGALSNPVPVTACRALGAEVVISVNVNVDIVGRGRRQDMLRDAAEEIDAVAAGVDPEPPRAPCGPRTPKLMGVVIQSMLIAQDRIARSRLAGDPPDFSVNPRLGHVGVAEFHRADEIIAEGEAATEAALPTILDMIEAYAAC